MPDASHPRASYADVLAAPEHLVAELIDGELVTSPRPRPRHSRAASRLGMILGPAYDLEDDDEEDGDGPGGWIILDEPELHLDDDVLVPDIAGWRRERLPSLPDTAWFDVAPDFALEVLSPSTARYDRGPKFEIYAAHGVTHLWLVDPELRMLEAFALTDGRYARAAVRLDDAVVALAPFEAAAFKLGRLWES